MTFEVKDQLTELVKILEGDYKDGEERPILIESNFDHYWDKMRDKTNVLLKVEKIVDKIEQKMNREYYIEIKYGYETYMFDGILSDICEEIIKGSIFNQKLLKKIIKKLINLSSEMENLNCTFVRNVELLPILIKKRPEKKLNDTEYDVTIKFNDQVDDFSGTKKDVINEVYRTFSSNNVCKKIKNALEFLYASLEDELTSSSNCSYISFENKIDIEVKIKENKYRIKLVSPELHPKDYIVYGNEEFIIKYFSQLIEETNNDVFRFACNSFKIGIDRYIKKNKQKLFEYHGELQKGNSTFNLVVNKL